jgi:hypothetical protein
MDVRKAGAFDNESISLLMAGRKEAQADETNR